VLKLSWLIWPSSSFDRQARYNILKILYRSLELITVNTRGARGERLEGLDKIKLEVVRRRHTNIADSVFAFQVRIRA
jgi:hypothetical protein